MTAEMIAAAGGDVHRAEHLFVLDVAAGDGQILRAETEFADLAGDRIADQLGVVGVDLLLVAAEQRGL